MSLETAAKININESSMTVKINATDIMLRSGDDPDSLRGIFVHKAGIDEARNFKTDYIYKIVLACCSQGSHPQIFISSTSKGRNWVAELRDEIGEDFCEVTQSSLDNKFTSDEYKQLLLASYTDKFARQEIYGDELELGAGVIESVWFRSAPYVKPLGHAIRYWDVAVSTKNAADFSASALCSMHNDQLLIHDMHQLKLSYPDLRRKIIETAIMDGLNTQIYVEEAGQQRGFIDDLATCPELGAFVIRAQKPHGDKFNRAMPWAARAQLGLVTLCEGPWNQIFRQQCDCFTADDSHEHDDMIDSVSGAYRALQGSNDQLVFTSVDEHNKDLINANESNPGFAEAFGLQRSQPGVSVHSLF
jgi:predicted phage terminase large subunit-like protein